MFNAFVLQLRDSRGTFSVPSPLFVPSPVHSGTFIWALWSIQETKYRFRDSELWFPSRREREEKVQVGTENMWVGEERRRGRSRRGKRKNKEMEGMKQKQSQQVAACRSALGPPGHSYSEHPQSQKFLSAFARVLTGTFPPSLLYMFSFVATAFSALLWKFLCTLKS